MPIYEYRCQECGHELEKLQRMSDDPLSLCPACGEARLKRLVSAAAFRLKGGGWYETDFKQGNQRNLAGGDSDSGKKGGSDSGKKADLPSDGGKASDSKSGDTASKSESKKSSSATGKAAST